MIIYFNVPDSTKIIAATYVYEEPDGSKAYAVRTIDPEDAEHVKDSEQITAEEVWTAAKRIVLNLDAGGLDLRELEKIFGTKIIRSIMLTNDYPEAILKLRAYDKQKAAEEQEIKIGDEIEVKNSGNKYVIGWINNDVYRGIAIDGTICSLIKKDLRKTGRHFSEIVNLIEKLSE